MDILVTGANVFVGRAVCEAGKRAGHQMIACRRAGGEADSVRIVADITDESGLAEAMAECETVIHLVARTHVLRETESDPLSAYRLVNVAGTKAVAEAARRADVRRIVFMSSIKVNGEQTGEAPYTEKSPPAPEDAYGETKLEAESVLREACERAQIDWVILRPPLVYGPGVGGNFRALMGLCDSGLPLPFGGAAENRRSMIAVENLASAALCAATHPAAPGKVFLVRDGSDLSTAALIRALRSAMGRRARLLPIPAGLMRMALAAAGKSAIARRLFGSLQINDSLIRETLGWRPVLDTKTALARTAEAWRAAKIQQAE